MPNFHNQLKVLRREAKLSQAEFAKQIGVSKSSINMYERGEREPSIETMESIADYFNVDMDFLLGKSNHRNKSAWLESIKNTANSSKMPDNILPLPKTKEVPLLGNIACGEPIFAAENVDRYISIPDDINADFCLRCKGDSMMNARIYDGDIVYIHQQPTVENGEIAAVLIEDEATLKRVQMYEDHIVLSPENPMYRPFVYWENEMNNVRIIGKAVAFSSRIR